MLIRFQKLVARNSRLAFLRDISLSGIQAALSSAIPKSLLDAPIDSYSVSSLRYSPGRKLLMGLTSPGSARGVALSVFQQGGLRQRLATARRTHPHHCFALKELAALAWVFPGDRKLKLGLLADNDRLADVLEQHRQWSLRDVQLVYFSPEYRYKARVTGVRRDGSPVEEYLHVFHDLSGYHIASLMQQLRDQLSYTDLGIPGSVSYIADDRILLQSALPREPGAQLSEKQAARALARLHGLTAVGLSENDRDYSSSLRFTEELVRAALPAQASLVTQIVPLIQAALDDTHTGPRVLLHGDVRRGNLIPLQHGRVGISDFHRMCWGAPEDDLADFYASRLWHAMRHDLNVDVSTSLFPEYIDEYNRQATHPVELGRAYAMLAYKLVADCIRRGITHGKIASGKELFGLLYAANCCLDEVWHCVRSGDISTALVASHASFINQAASRTAPGPGTTTG